MATMLKKIESYIKAVEEVTTPPPFLDAIREIDEKVKAGEIDEKKASELRDLYTTAIAFECIIYQANMARLQAEMWGTPSYVAVGEVFHGKGNKAIRILQRLSESKRKLGEDWEHLPAHKLMDKYLEMVNPVAELTKAYLDYSINVAINNIKKKLKRVLESDKAELEDIVNEIERNLFLIAIELALNSNRVSP